MRIAEFAVHRRVAVAMLSLAIVVLGLFAAPRLAVALLPTFAPPVVSVTVAYSNVSPETMETTITRPIENAVSRVAGIDFIESSSYQGLSTVRVQFQFGTDINVAAVDVQQQIARIRATLPNDPALQEPQIAKADPNATPVLTVAVTDPSMTQSALSDLIVNALSDEFASVHGVGSLSVSGATQRAVVIEPDERKLAAIGLPIDTLLQRINNENVELPAGVIQIGQDEYGIRTSALFTAPEQIADTVIAVGADGAIVRLRDVATVRDSIQEQRVFSRLNGSPSVLLTITAQPNANIVAVATGVSEKIDQIKARYPSMEFSTLLDQREFILDAVSSLEHTALYGSILAVLIILLFLHSWRAMLIVAISLPVSILGTLFIAQTLGETLNVMTLGGLALAVGLIVDDAVVVIENISRFHAMGMSSEEAAEGGTAQIMGAVIASSITVVTVFFPVLFIPGLQGLIFGPFAIVVMSAVAISLLVAVTAVPMLSAEMLHHQDETKTVGARVNRFGAAFDRAYGRLARGYRRLLEASLDRPALILGSAFALIAITSIALLLGVVPTEIFPPSDTRFVQLGLQTPNGTALGVTNHVSQIVEDALRKDPRVVAVGATVGQVGSGGTARSITNRATLQVTLRRGTDGAAAARFVSDWRRRLNGNASEGDRLLAPQDAARLRSAMVGVITRGQAIDIVQQQVSQGQTALELEIYGPDLATLQSVSDGVMAAISKIPGVGDPDKNVTNSQPEVRIAIDRTRVSELGLGTGDVAQVINSATNGSTASYYQINGIQYPIIVELPPNQRRSFGSLQSLEFTMPSARTTTVGASLRQAGLSESVLPQVTLGSVAQITQGYGPSAISRENRQRRVEIQAPLAGRPLGPVLTDATAAMEAYPFPPGYRWEFGPEIARGRNAFASLWLEIALAALLIYMLLAAQFESYIDPLVIMVSAPLSLVGIVSALLLTHRAFGLTAFVGSLMLIGIAVKNAILVIEFTKQLREQGEPVREALLAAAPLRLRPILMTTLATLGGMLPLALGIEVGSSTQAPLATVVIGGLIASTILSLVVVPTLYLVVARGLGDRFRTRRRDSRAAAEPIPR